MDEETIQISRGGSIRTPSPGPMMEAAWLSCKSCGTEDRILEDVSAKLSHGVTVMTLDEKKKTGRRKLIRGQGIPFAKSTLNIVLLAF